jgi:hypothetical protein
MSELSKNQIYHLILADIAMVAAIDSHGSQVLAADRKEYAPGSIRDHWIARTPDSLSKRRVLAMANAAVASLQQMTAEGLIATAGRMGVPFEKDTAQGIAEFFAQRRDAILQYNEPLAKFRFEAYLWVGIPNIRIGLADQT